MSVKKITKRFFWVLALLLPCLIILSLIAFIVVMTGVRDKANETKIDAHFHEELKNLPQVKVNRFVLWEGDSNAEIMIAGKGKVVFWYGSAFVPHIEFIGDKSIEINCEVTNSDGKREYVYTDNLEITEESPFKKWFSFEVKSMSDLVGHYDDIIKILDTFPTNPETVSINGSWGTRDFIKHIDPNFSVQGGSLTSLIDWRYPTCPIYLKSYPQ